MTDEEVELLFDAIIERDDIWISEMLVRRIRDACRRGRGRSKDA